jgi:hypothetical protein
MNFVKLSNKPNQRTSDLFSLPLDAKRFAVEVIKGSSILVNSSQPDIVSSADVALTEAIYLDSVFLSAQSLPENRLQTVKSARAACNYAGWVYKANETVFTTGIRRAQALPN